MDSITKGDGAPEEAVDAYAAAADSADMAAQDNLPDESDEAAGAAEAPTTGAEEPAVADEPADAATDDPTEEPPSAPEGASDSDLTQPLSALAATRVSMMSLPSFDNDPDLEPEPAQASQDAADAALALDAIKPIEGDLPNLQQNFPTVSDHVAMGGADVPRKRRWPFVLLALVLACAIVYVVGALYFLERFFPNTTVNGEDVSNMTVAELSAYVTNLGATYKTHVEGEGLDFDIEGSDIDFVYDGATYGSEAGDQISAWTWPMELNRPHAYTVNKGISFDEDKLEKIVEDEVEKLNEEAKSPEDATMRYDDDAEKFVVEPEKPGTVVGSASVVAKATQGVAGMATEVKVDEDDLVQPEVTSTNKDLLAGIDRSNELLKAKIDIRVADHDVGTVDKDQIKDWIWLDEDLDFRVRKDDIAEWAKGDLSDEADTVGNRRTFTRPDGKEITVEGGSYGWIIDGEELAQVITDNLKDDNTDPIDAPMKRTADSWNPDGKEWPNRYIDVDLAEQHVRLYNDDSDVIWESDCVSGNTSEGHGTILGVYFIEDKASPMKLVGLDYDHDGQPDYESDVTYWMPFSGGYGLHDATWRSAFGGNIYTYNGSHGCVNLPYTDAQELYGMVNIGDVVVVHD